MLSCYSHYCVVIIELYHWWFVSSHLYRWFVYHHHIFCLSLSYYHVSIWLFLRRFKTPIRGRLFFVIKLLLYYSYFDKCYSLKIFEEFIVILWVHYKLFVFTKKAVVGIEMVFCKKVILIILLLLIHIVRVLLDITRLSSKRAMRVCIFKTTLIFFIVDVVGGFVFKNSFTIGEFQFFILKFW